MNEADTSSRNGFDAFRFKSLVPSLLSRIDGKVSEAFVEETNDEEASLDTSEVDSSELLSEGANLLARLGLKADDFDRSDDMDVRADVHQDPEDDNDTMTTDNMNANIISASQVSELPRSQSICGFISTSSSIPEGPVMSPVPNNDYTRSPTLVQDSKDGQSYADSNESNVCKLDQGDVTGKTVKEASDQAMELYVSEIIAPIAHTFPTNKGASYADRPVDTDSLAAHDTIPSSVTFTHGSPSTGSTRHNLTLSDLSSPRSQDIPSTMACTLLARQSIPDPFRRMFESVFDEATAAWEEEARLREAIGSLKSSIVGRLVEQEPVVQKTLLDRTLGAHSPSGITHPSLQSLPKLDDNSSKADEQSSFVMHDNHDKSQRAIGPREQTPVLLSDAPVESISLDAIVQLDPSRSCTDAPRASHKSTLTVDTPLASVRNRPTADDKDIVYAEQASEYIDVVAKAVCQSLTISEAVVNSMSTDKQAQPTGRFSEGADDHVQSGANPRATAQSTEAVSGGVSPDARQPSIEATASTPTAISVTDHQLNPLQNQILIPSPAPSASPIVAASIVDGYSNYGQSKDARPTGFSRDTANHFVEDNILPPLFTISKGTPVSRPLKRRLSSSTIIKKEKESDVCTSSASQTNLSSHRPLKIKKLEDESDVKKLLKVEPKKEEPSADLNPRSLTSSHQLLPLATSAESSTTSQVEDTHGREMGRECSPCFQYPPLEVAIMQDNSAITSTVTSIHPQLGSSDDDGEFATQSNLLGKGNGEITVGGSAGSNHNLSHHISAPSPCPDVCGDSGVQVTQERVAQERFIPVRKVSRGYESSILPAAGNIANRVSYSPDGGSSPPRRGRSPNCHVGHFSPTSRGTPDDRYPRSGRIYSRPPSRRRSRSPSPYRSRQANDQLYRDNPRRSPPRHRQESDSALPHGQDTNTIRLGRHNVSSGIPIGPRNSQSSSRTQNVDVPMIGHHEVSTSVGYYVDDHIVTSSKASQHFVSFPGRHDRFGDSSVHFPARQHSQMNGSKGSSQPPFMSLQETRRLTSDAHAIPAQPAVRTLLDRTDVRNPHRLEYEQRHAPTMQNRSYQTNSGASCFTDVSHAPPIQDNETPTLLGRITGAGDTELAVNNRYEPYSDVAWPNQNSKSRTHRGFSITRGNISRGRYNATNPTRHHPQNSRGRAGHYLGRKSRGS